MKIWKGNRGVGRGGERERDRSGETESRESPAAVAQ